MTPSRNTKLLMALLLVALADLGIVFGGHATVRYACAYLLLLVLPGLGLVRLLTCSNDDLVWFERIALGLAASYPFTISVTLVAGYVPGKLTLALELALATACVSAIWLTTWWQDRVSPRTHHKPRPTPGWSLVILTVIVLIACLFVLTNLGVSEFQGDEVMALLTGSSTIQGNDEAMFFHRKGPAEILLPTALWLLSGTVTEWMARLPFAIAGILSVIAMYALARRLFGEGAGLAAAALLALNGYLIGFSRIVQYQSIVMMATIMAIFCFVLFTRQDLPRYQILGAVFVATGLLAHYDAVFMLPAIAYLYATTAGGIRGWLRHWRSLLIALLVGVGMAGLFYVPFLQPAYLAQTSDYLAFRSGGNPFYNNLSLWFLTGTTYNSSYYVIILVLLAIAAVLGMVRSRSLGLKIGLGLAGMLACAALSFPELWTAAGQQLVFVPFVALLALAYVALAPTSANRLTKHADSAGPRLALIWFGVPFLVYDFFLVKHPGTHFWTMFPGLILLSAFGLDTLRRALQRIQLRQPIRIAVGAVFAASAAMLFGCYLYLVFVRADPEYRAGYPDTKSPIYWTAYDELPERDFFGFPHRAGWKAIGALYEQETLDGEYDSNEGGEITAWYLPAAPRYFCNPAPRYYFLAESTQDPREESEPTQLDDAFTEVGVVTVGGRPGIRIFEQGAAPQPVSEYAVERYAPDFDTVRQPWDQWAAMEQFISNPYSVNFGNAVELIGYDLDTSEGCPAGHLLLTLYWQRHGLPIPESYKVFAHLEGDRLWAQADDVPGCSAWPTTGWKSGEIIADRHVIELPDDIPRGEYALSVGLYEPNHGVRLDVIDDAGNAQGNSLHLTDVAVEPCADVKGDPK